MNTLKVKRLSADAVMPAYAHPGDAGLDLYAAVSASLDPGEAKLIGTGISIELPPNAEGNVRPRSGLALKHGITVLNSFNSFCKELNEPASFSLIAKPFSAKSIAG